MPIGGNLYGEKGGRGLGAGRQASGVATRTSIIQPELLECHEMCCQTTGECATFLSFAMTRIPLQLATFNGHALTFICVHLFLGLNELQPTNDAFHWLSLLTYASFGFFRIPLNVEAVICCVCFGAKSLHSIEFN